MNKYKIGQKVTYKRFGVISMGKINSIKRIISYYDTLHEEINYTYRIERHLNVEGEIEEIIHFDVDEKDIIINQVTEEVLIKLKKLNNIAKNMRMIASNLDKTVNGEIEFNHWSRIKEIDSYIRLYKNFLSEESK